MLITFLKKIRIFFLKKILWKKYHIGKNFHCGRGVFLWARDEIFIGDDCYIGKYSIVETNCTIGNGVLIANHVGIVGKYDHNYQDIGIPIRLASQIREKSYNWKGLNQNTVIGDDVWIGFGAIVMSGVRISEGCIIAAGAVVTKDTDSYSIYAGVPARKIGNRFNTKQELDENLSKLRQKYHNLPTSST